MEENKNYEVVLEDEEEDEYAEVVFDDEEAEDQFNTSDNVLEITFKVKPDFAPLFKGIHNIYQEMGIPCVEVWTHKKLGEFIGCIDKTLKVVSKEALYNLIETGVKEEKKKKAKKIAKRNLGKLLKSTLNTRELQMLCTFGLGITFTNINVESIFEKHNGTYCRVEFDADLFKHNIKQEIDRLGKFIGSYAEEVVETVEIAGKTFREFYPKEFEVKDNYLNVYNVFEKNISIKLVDMYKVYLVEANIEIPDVMTDVIKQVDKVDHILEENLENETEQSKLLHSYNKLTYHYDLVCTFIKDNQYTMRTCDMRPYEKARVFEDFGEDIKKILRCDDFEDNIFIPLYALGNMCNYSDIVYGLLKVDENKFSEDYKHWTFKGTFHNIDREFLESAFEKIKENIQAHGVSEQYINIRVAEIQ